MEYGSLYFNPKDSSACEIYLDMLFSGKLGYEAVDQREMIQSIDLNCLGKQYLEKLIFGYPGYISEEQIQKFDIKKINDLNNRDLNKFLKHFGNDLTKDQKMSRRTYFKDTPINRLVGSNDTNFSNHNRAKDKNKDRSN